MREDVPEILFASRDDFRVWLKENAETSKEVWHVFGKIKAVVTQEQGCCTTSGGNKSFEFLYEIGKESMT